MSGELESRSAGYRPGGKADVPMKTTLTEEAALLASRRAHELGVTPAEYLRDLVMVNLYGAEHMLSLYRQHLKVIGQNGARNGTSGV